MFIRKSIAKNLDGKKRIYFQLAESVRIDGKPRNRVICSLGRADDKATQEKIMKMAESLISACEEVKFFSLGDLKFDFSREYGPFLVFKRLFKDLGFEDILRAQFLGVESDFDIVEALFNMMLNRVTDPTSKRQLSLWEARVEGVQSFDLHQYYRALDYLADKKDRVEREVFFGMRDLFLQELDIVLFDTTSLVYYGEGGKKDNQGKKPEDQQLLDNGFSKAHRGDLPQVVVGVLMSKEGIPLGHEVFSGNTNDVKCFSQIIEQLKKKYSLSRIILVGDRGMISKENIGALKKSKLDYILGYRMRTISKECRKKILSNVDLRGLKNSDLKFKEADYQGQRLIVCYNEERAQKDKDHRERQVEDLRKKLKGKSLKNLISNPHYRRFIKVNSSKTKAELDEEKIKNDELYDGIFVLTTNTNLSAVQCVERYKDLWQVEHAFRSLKSELEVGPIYHFRDRRIRAHIMICFLAFCMRAALYKKLKAYFGKEKFSFTELMNDLKQLHAIEFRTGETPQKFRTELKDGTTHIFKAIGMRPPNRNLGTKLQICSQTSASVN